MIELFFSALALMLVFEGMLPFLSPRCWRQTMRQLSQMEDKSIRIVGAVLMALGVILLYVMHNNFLGAFNG